MCDEKLEKDSLIFCKSSLDLTHQAGQNVGIMQNTPYKQHTCQALTVKHHIQKNGQ